jgi:quinolinate synthase
MFIIEFVNSRSQIIPYEGCCNIHDRVKPEDLQEALDKHGPMKILAHPECKGAVLALADFVGSTAAILKYAVKSDKKNFIVSTESGIIHEMRKQCPEKNFIPAPPIDSTCGCNECNFMRLNSLEKLYNCLKYEWPTIEVDEAVAKEAVKPIKRMLEVSEKLGL